MRGDRLADRLVMMPEAPINPKRQMRLYFFYRVLLAISLLLFYFTDAGPAFLGASAPELHLQTAIVHLVLTLASLAVSFFNIGSQNVEYGFAVLVDAIVISILMYTSGGPQSGLGILLGVSIAFAAQGMTGFTSMLAAVVAALAVFIESWAAQMSGIRTEPSWFFTTLLAVSYFALAFLSHELASRASTNERLIRQQGKDISNLTELSEHVIQQMQTGVVILDKESRIQMLNDAAWLFLGRPISTIGYPLEEINPALATELEIWKRQPYPHHQHLHIQSEVSDLLVSFQRLGNTGKSGILMFLDDASQAAATAQQLKLASLGRLVASIAHEIRNPLGAIGHANQLLQESDQLAGTDRRMTEIIDKNTSRLNEVIENILSLSRQRSPQPELLNLSPWLEKFGQEMVEAGSLAPEQMVIQVSPQTTQLLFDPQQLLQVISILVENAIKHQAQQEDHLIITLAGGVDSGTGEGYIDIIDNGSRIPKKIIDKIFDPFFTTAKNGTGLGLYVAKELCDANNIRLSYLPVATGGNCFKLKFNTSMTISG